MARADTGTSAHRLIEQIKNTLQTNGYPQKKVALPLDKISASALKCGLKLLDLISILSVYGIRCELDKTRIIFHAHKVKLSRKNLASIHCVEYQGGNKPNERYALGISVICRHDLLIQEISHRIREMIISWSTKRRKKAARLLLSISTKADLVNRFHEEINRFYARGNFLCQLLSLLEFKVQYSSGDKMLQTVDYPRLEGR